MGNVQQLRTPAGSAFEGGAAILGAAAPSGPPGLSAGREDATSVSGAPAAGADPLASGLTVEAIVKWFSADKGYGFVELAGSRGDAFVHLKTLRQIGRETLPSGAKLRAIVRSGSRGPQVVRVIEVDATSVVEQPEPPQRRPTPDASTAIDLTGRVTWFDGARGFGFVASDDYGKDVFVHSSILGAAGFSGLAEGQTVSRRVETQNGQGGDHNRPLAEPRRLVGWRDVKRRAPTRGPFSFAGRAPTCSARGKRDQCAIPASSPVITSSTSATDVCFGSMLSATIFPRRITTMRSTT
jgi:CspA family cold shock protein